MIEIPLWIAYYTIFLSIDFFTVLIFKFSLAKFVNGLFSTKCYNFNVDKQVKSMGNGFTNAAKDFKNNFGKMNFSDVF